MRIGVLPELIGEKQPVPGHEGNTALEGRGRVVTEAEQAQLTRRAVADASGQNERPAERPGIDECPAGCERKVHSVLLIITDTTQRAPQFVINTLDPLVHLEVPP